MFYRSIPSSTVLFQVLRCSTKFYHLFQVLIFIFIIVTYSIQGVYLASSVLFLLNCSRFEPSTEGTSAVLLSGQRDTISRRGEGKWFIDELAIGEE